MKKNPITVETLTSLQKLFDQAHDATRKSDAVKLAQRFGSQIRGFCKTAIQMKATCDALTSPELKGPFLTCAARIVSDSRNKDTIIARNIGPVIQDQILSLSS
jgi:hypothetical protein